MKDSYLPPRSVLSVRAGEQQSTGAPLWSRAPGDSIQPSSSRSAGDDALPTRSVPELPHQVATGTPGGPPQRSAPTPQHQWRQSSPAIRLTWRSCSPGVDSLPRQERRLPPTRRPSPFRSLRSLPPQLARDQASQRCLANFAMPRRLLSALTAFPSGRKAMSNCFFETSIPTNRCRSSITLLLSSSPSLHDAGSLGPSDCSGLRRLLSRVRRPVQLPHAVFPDQARARPAAPESHFVTSRS